MSPTRRNATIGLLAAGATLPAAQAFGQAIQPVGEAHDSDEPSAQIKTTQSRNEHMLAPVQINGQGPFQFVIDTGANASCISHRLMNRLALQTHEMAPVHTVVGVSQRPVVLLDELRVGPRNRRRVRAPALPIKGVDVDGVLGIDWLKGQRLSMDFRNRSLEITRSRADVGEAGRAVVVPARRRYGQLTIVDADLSGRRISAIIDSGAQATLCNSRLRDIVRAQEARKGRREPPVMVKMETLAGEPFVGESVFLPFLRLGGLHLGNVPVTCADMHVFKLWDLEETPALVIGMDLLAQFERVALDFGRSQVRFDFV